MNSPSQAVNQVNVEKRHFIGKMQAIKLKIPDRLSYFVSTKVYNFRLSFSLLLKSCPVVWILKDPDTDIGPKTEDGSKRKTYIKPDPGE